MFDTDRNCWKIARATRLAVVVDAADYFATVRQALLAARERVMLVGWDFDGRIGFHVDDRLPGEPDTIGDFLLWLVERTPTLEVHLLRWDVGALKTLFRGSTAVTALKWAMHARIHLKLDGHHPTGSSHHQKLVAIDDAFAFCGGIDMTGDRWDTREHVHDDPRRVQPGGKPYKPWHDATTAMSGPVAAVIGEECRNRWARATGETIPAPADRDECWPDGLSATFEDIDVAIARSYPEMDDQKPIYEIETLYLDQIAAAKDVIYLESQYFAARRIAEALARRLDEPDGPEIVLVNPETAEGWLQPLAMDSARARLVAALRKRDVHGRLAVYHPYTSGGEPVYVHAKIAVIDDRFLRVGSANLNNRSMRLDTECDMSVDADRDRARRFDIAAIRDGLLAEHLGLPVADIVASLAGTGSVIATIEALRGTGRSLRPYEIPDLSSVEEWLADNEVLDPEEPDDMFEPFASGGLLSWARS